MQSWYILRWSQNLTKYPSFFDITLQRQNRVKFMWPSQKILTFYEILVK